jgi:HK97 family phage prohead protease
MFTKEFALELDKKSFSDDGKYGYFEGYGSIFGNIDSGGDIIERGAFIDSLAQRMPKMLWQHSSSEPIGVYEVAYEDEKGLFLRGKIFLEISRGREAYILLKNGAIDGLSIGFRSGQSEWREEKVEEQYIRRYTKANLYEVSLVTFPMNELANIHAVKSAIPFQDLPLASADIEWNPDLAIQRVRDFLQADEAPNPAYKRGFSWYDKAQPESFSSYKLPIADIVSGELVAVPRAIFAAAAAINGARGCINIPDSEIPAIKSHVERYYTKMGKPSPFQKTLKITQAQNLKACADVLKNYGLTNSQIDHLISVIKNDRTAGDQQSKKKGDDSNAGNQQQDYMAQILKEIRQLKSVV